MTDAPGAGTHHGGVVDADGHVVEPRAAWDAVPERYRPRIDRDAEGIDRAVLYPSVGLYFWALDDPAAAVPIATAYNDWLASYCAADPQRLFGAAMVPVQDPAAAAAEVRRAHDEQAESFGGFCPQMRLAPSEYFARQCWISYEIDEHTLAVLAPLIGEDRIVWGSDYPHHDATFPGAVTTLRRTIAPLAEDTQRRILGGNASELYRLPPWPAAPGAGT